MPPMLAFKGKKKRQACVALAWDDDQPVESSARAAPMQQSSRSLAAARIATQAALAQDASIFDYDAAHDGIQRARDRHRGGFATGGSGTTTGSRYIGSIMEAHKVREIENDKLYEKRLHKEAQADAHLYGDKEKFITAAYRQKLEARAAYEEEERRRAKREIEEDVTKRGGLMHFHRNLLQREQATNTQTSEPRELAYQCHRPNSTSSSRGNVPSHCTRDGKASSSSSTFPEYAFSSRDTRATHTSSSSTMSSQLASTFAVSGVNTPEDHCDLQHGHRDETSPKGRNNVSTDLDSGTRRRNDDQAVALARERYLARKRQKQI